MGPTKGLVITHSELSIINTVITISIRWWLNSKSYRAATQSSKESRSHQYRKYVIFLKHWIILGWKECRWKKQSYSVAGPEYKIKMWASVKCIWTTLQILYNKTAALPSLPIANQAPFGREAPHDYLVLRRVALCRPGWPGPSYADQSGFATTPSFASVSKSWVIGVHNYSLVWF